MLIRCPVCKKETELEHVERGRHIECVCHARFALDDATVIADYSKMDEPPPSQIGDYKIDRFIGRGGMGKVYKGRHPTLGIPVAVKTLLPEFADNRAFRDRFRYSAKICAKIDHPNIVRIYDVGTTEEGLVYIVMEYIAGGTLYDLLIRSGPLNPRKAAEIAAAVCSGLTAAWKAGIVHRDIKPDNIMISSDGEYKLSDLGLAKYEPLPSSAPQPVRTVTGPQNVTETLELSSIGTPEYMAPEQALDAKNCDIRADIYSLGITLYQLLVDRLPFIASSRAELRRMHLEEEPKVPGFYRPDLPIDLEYIVMRCMQKRKTDRYQTPDEVRADLLAYLDGEPLPSTTGTVSPQNFDIQYPVSFPRVAINRMRILQIAILAVFFTGALVAVFSLIPREEKTEVQMEEKNIQTPPVRQKTREEQWANWEKAAASALRENTGFTYVIANLKMFENDENPKLRLNAVELINKLKNASDRAVRQKMEELDKKADPLIRQRRFTEAKELYSHTNVPGLEMETRSLREKRQEDLDEKIRLRQEQIENGFKYLENDVIPLLAAGKYDHAKKQYESRENPDPDPELLKLITECSRIPALFAENIRTRNIKTIQFEFQNEPFLSLSQQQDLVIAGIQPPNILITYKDNNYSFTIDDLTPGEQAAELAKITNLSTAAQALWNLNIALAQDPAEAKIPSKEILPESLIVPYEDYVKRRIEKKQETQFRKELLELFQAKGWSGDLPTPEEISQIENLPSYEDLQVLIRKYETIPSLSTYISVLRRMEKPGNSTFHAGTDSAVNPEKTEKDSFHE